MRADKSLSPFEIRVYRHYRIVHGTRVALAFLLTFLIIRLFTPLPHCAWYSGRAGIPAHFSHYPPVYYPGKHLAAGHHGGDYGANLVLG